jgi:predicted metal-dependent phosphoesterase TrpH
MMNFKDMRRTIFLLLIISACTTRKEKESDPTFFWYKGNTHTHTVLCGHADTHPDTVAMWYLERDYNFLILSEHNTFIDPDSVNLPANRRKDFILIPGEEVSDEKHIHTTAMNINRLIPISFPFKYDSVKYNPYENLKIFYMKKHVDSIRGAGGIPILNHPNWLSGAPASSIQQVEGLNMIELYNGHPDVNNWGNEKHASMEVKWDSLLTAGRKIYGVSSDDAHFFQDWGVDVSNPGRGWVMVKSEALTPDAITTAMTKGDFYSSNGVMLSEIEISDDTYRVSIDTAATYLATGSPFVVGYKSAEVKDGFWIEFITDNGTVIKTDENLASSMDIPEKAIYVRAKVTYSRSRGSNSEQFFAWTQPVFLSSN